MKGIWYIEINSIPFNIAASSEPSTSIFIKATFFCDKNGIKLLRLVKIISVFFSKFLVYYFFYDK